MTTTPVRVTTDTTDITDITDQDPQDPWSPAEFEERLRDVAATRYHDRHPFNVRMHEGALTPAELRRWITNRFHYQRHIPSRTP